MKPQQIADLGKMITAIILDGKVYVADPACSSCVNCAVFSLCNYAPDGTALCIKFGATEGNDFGFRYSQELTDKINEKY